MNELMGMMKMYFNVYLTLRVYDRAHKNMSREEEFSVCVWSLPFLLQYEPYSETLRVFFFSAL